MIDENNVTRKEQETDRRSCWFLDMLAKEVVMNKLMIGVVGGALVLTAGTAVARPIDAAQQPLI
ncbi:hypothetical protein SM191_14980 [Sphingomonas sp. 2378]